MYSTGGLYPRAFSEAFSGLIFRFLRLTGFGAYRRFMPGAPAFVPASARRSRETLLLALSAMKRSGIGARPRSGQGPRRSRRPRASLDSRGCVASSGALSRWRSGLGSGPRDCGGGRATLGESRRQASRSPGHADQTRSLDGRRGPNRPLRLRGRAAARLFGREGQDNKRTFANVCGQPLRRGLEASRSRPFRPLAAHPSMRGGEG